MTIESVGVAGCGLMGAGIAQEAARNGYETVVREVDGELIESGLARIRSFLDRGVERGKLATADRDATLARLPGTTELADLAACDLVIEAVRALEEGVGSIEDIDAGMKLGCGHPMGPLTLLDLVGLDTTVAIAEVFFGEFKDARYATPPLLRRMVLAGYRGRKSGNGFYDYSGDTPVPNDFLCRPAGGR